jgi:hypothetical protein
MSDLYFGSDVDQALVLFQLEPEIDAKNNIFISDIKPAFEKLIKYHYYRTPITRNEEVMHDCMSFLYEILKNKKFDSTKYTRGFPYFNMIVKHFFIQRLKVEKKKIATDKNIDSLSNYQANQKIFDTVLLTEDVEEEYQNREFINILKENLPKWRDQFQKEQEKQFVDALILLFENAKNIDIYNKKAIFLYLREITNLNSKQIATNLNKVKKKFSFLKKKYLRGDI